MENQAPAPEAPQLDTPVAQAPAAEAPKPVSPQFQALAKKEQAIVRRQQELKRLEEELKAKESKYNTYEEKRARAKLNPLDALQELGLNYEEITQYILNDKKPTAEQSVESVKEEMRRMREDYEKAQREERETQEKRAKEAQEQQVQAFKADLGDYIKTNADKYELLNLEGDEGVELVYETISTDWQNKIKRYNENGRIGRPPKMISTEEASDLVEKFIEEKYETAYSKANKLKNKFGKAPEAEAPQAPGQMPKTLNNGLIQPSSPSSLPAKNEQDRMARALKALGG